MTAPQPTGFAPEERPTVAATLFRPDPTERIGSGVLLRAPQDVSASLPSRGMLVVEGTINGVPCRAALEPDGKGSHWAQVSGAIRAAANADMRDAVTLEIAPSKDWPEPKAPTDLAHALAAAPSARALWRDLIPLARRDWIRRIGAARTPQTRRRWVDVTIDKLAAGKRRRCCFDRTQRTLTDA